MIVPFRPDGLARNIERRRRMKGSAIMKWETPEAVDFRFGMEITMYVANR